jgi:hypothetical protein
MINSVEDKETVVLSLLDSIISILLLSAISFQVILPVEFLPNSRAVGAQAGASHPS